MSTSMLANYSYLAMDHMHFGYIYMHLWLHPYVVKLHYGSDVAIDGCIAKMHVIHMSSVQLYMRSTTLRVCLLAIGIAIIAQACCIKPFSICYIIYS